MSQGHAIAPQPEQQEQNSISKKKGFSELDIEFYYILLMHTKEENS